MTRFHEIAQPERTGAIHDVAVVDRVSIVSPARAQGNGAYDIVSFGPLNKEHWVRREERYRGTLGGIRQIHGNGTAFGALPASEEKFSPALFAPDGALTRLPSGTYGGFVNAINASGQAAGSAFDEVGIIIAQGFFTSGSTKPVAWIDGEMVRLPIPETGSTSRTGSASGISDAGAVLGVAANEPVLWVNGEPEILLDQDGDISISYRTISASGKILGYRFLWTYNDQGIGTPTYEQGFFEGGTFTAIAVPDEVAGGNPGFIAINSADEVLFQRWPTDLRYQFITGSGMDPIVIDHREEGIDFGATGFNASHEIVGTWSPREGAATEPVLYRDGTFTPLAELLPTDHGYTGILLSGISDDGIISGSGWDADYSFHPLLFVPR